MNYGFIHYKDNIYTKIILATHFKLAERYGFKRTDKYLYSKNVNLDEVEIIEERKLFSLD